MHAATPPPARRNAIALAVRTAVGLAILVVALGVYGLLAGTKPPAPRVERADIAMTVQTVSVRRTDTPWQWTGYGTTRARDAADVAAEVAGLVVERPDAVDPGRWVSRGELIVALARGEFDDRAERSRAALAGLEADRASLDVELESLQETLAWAQEAVRLNEAELERLEGAIDRGSASRFELEGIQEQLTRDRREAELIRRSIRTMPQRVASNQARISAERASLRLAELDVSRTRIAAPITGMLQTVEVDLGERVSIGQVVARLVDLRRIEIPLRIPVSALGTISIGDPVRLRLSADRSGGWEGRVARVAPEADPATRTVTVFVDVEQEVDPTSGGLAERRRLLLPGQFVIGEVSSSGSEPRIVVPRSAVVGDRVLVVGESDRARSVAVSIERVVDRRYPEIHPEETQWAVIDAGLVGGERVIVSNLDDLTHGSLVSAAEAGSALASDGGQAGQGSGRGATP
jgi:RND family efflux transporter MFP subunit